MVLEHIKLFLQIFRCLDVVGVLVWQIVFCMILNWILCRNCDPFKDNYGLLEAVKFSMETEGCTLHEMLKKKTYLRITVGAFFGKSPGSYWKIFVSTKLSMTITNRVF